MIVILISVETVHLRTSGNLKPRSFESNEFLQKDNGFRLGLVSPGSKYGELYPYKSGPINAKSLEA